MDYLGYFHIAPYSFLSVLPVHTAPDTFVNGIKTMKRSYCSALDKKENATNWFTELATAKNFRFRCSHCILRFQKSPFSQRSSVNAR